jgi:aminoglycoside/choline kinase family phosphotransferase
MRIVDIPNGPQDLTPQWVTQALRTSGTAQKAKVISLETTELAKDSGITCQRFRLRLGYDVQETDAPRTLVAKLSASDPHARARCHSMRVYEREVRFYELLADQADLPTPRCYYAAVDDTGASVLLLEDLTPARCGDMIAGGSLPKAERAIRELARFQAAWWEDPRLDEMDWVVSFSGAQIEQIMAPLWAPLLKLVAGRLPCEELVARLRTHIAALWDQVFDRAPRTLLHGDYQPNNLFFATPEGGVPFAVIDWQALSRGRGAYDFAFYLCRGTSAKEARRAIEMGLLEAYHTTLVENGVQGYTLERCIDDYRLSMLSLFAKSAATFAAMAPSLSLNQKSQYLDVWLPCQYAAVSDLNASELLPA